MHLILSLIYFLGFNVISYECLSAYLLAKELLIMKSSTEQPTDIAIDRLNRLRGHFNEFFLAYLKLKISYSSYICLVVFTELVKILGNFDKCL